mmetsp:Transcript_26553/g.56107  ORF Transcript_26553/g.56107 Transcript_26553/m.56107 type:complete len:239 (+) Transcript_26553:51-767(+)
MVPKHTSIISLIGPPGSGKGTYGALLAAHFLDSSFISVGDILRESSATNKNLASILRSGVLVDDATVNDAVMHSLINRFRAKEESRKDLVILDGYPRTSTQASLLSKWPAILRPSFAIHVDVPDDICTTKLLGRRKCSICNGSFNINEVDTDGFNMPPILPKAPCKEMCDPDVHWEKRDDDTADTLKLRLEVYHKETKPVLKYWEERDQLLRFVPFNGVKDMGKLVSLVKNHSGEISE